MRRTGLIIALAALALRVWGVQYGLPHLYHQDEPILVNHALAAALKAGDPGFYVIPGFTIYALLGVYGAVYLIGRGAGVWADTDAFAGDFMRDPSLLYGAGRIVLGAVCGALTVYCLWRIALKWLGRRTALWSAVFLAIAPMHVQHSRYIYADVPLALALTVLLGALCAILERPVARRYVYGGAIFGWALAVKYTALYVLPAAITTHLLSQKSAIGSLRAWGVLCGAALATVVVFICLDPYVVLNTAAFVGQLLHQKGAEVATGPLHHLTYSIAGGTGWALLALSALGGYGLWTGGYRRRNIAVISAVYALSYYGVNICFSQHFARYMMPLVPVVCLMAGAGVDVLASKGRKGIVALALSVVLIESAVPALYGSYLFGAQDTRTQCLDWFERNVPPGSVVALDNKALGPRLTPTRAQLSSLREGLSGDSAHDAVRARRLDIWERSIPIDAKRYAAFVLVPPEQVIRAKRFLSEQAVIAADPGAMQEVGVAYLVVNDMDRDPAVDRLLRSLSNRIERVAVFSPYRDARRVSPVDRISTTAAPHLAADVLSRERLGPYLEVYRVKT